MTDPHSLEELDARLRDAKRRQAGGGRAQGGAEAGGTALGFAWRVGLELVSALVVGVGIGYLLDRWLGTKPWLLILFFVLGSAAGILNVFRLTSGLGGSVGYRKEPESKKTGVDDADEE
jgi:ATP synthase protein I